MKMPCVFIFSLFSVVMAAVSEVSLCQVPVGLTCVFEADDRSENTLWSLDGSLSHTHTGTYTATHTRHAHTHRQTQVCLTKSQILSVAGVDLH